MYLPISSRLARIRTGLAVALPLNETYTQANTAVADISDVRDAYAITGTFAANADGPFGSALTFDGTQRLVSPSSDSLLGVEDFAFSAFVNVTTVGAASQFVFSRSAGATTSNRDWSLASVNGTGAASWTQYNSALSPDAFVLGAFPSTPSGVWIHMAGSKTGTSSILIQRELVSGAMDQQVKHGRNIMRTQATAKLAIASLSISSQANAFVGSLSRLAVWRRALTLEELLAVRDWPMN